MVDNFAISCSRRACRSKSVGLAGCDADRDVCRCNFCLRCLKCALSASFYFQMLGLHYLVAESGQVCGRLLATCAFRSISHLLAAFLVRRDVCRCNFCLRCLKLLPSGSFYFQMLGLYYLVAESGHIANVSSVAAAFERCEVVVGFVFSVAGFDAAASFSMLPLFFFVLMLLLLLFFFCFCLCCRCCCCCCCCWYCSVWFKCACAFHLRKEKGLALSGGCQKGRG